MEFQGAFEICVNDGGAVGNSLTGAYLDAGNNPVGFGVDGSSCVKNFLVFFQLFFEDGELQAVDGKAVVCGGGLLGIVQVALGFQEGVIAGFSCVIKALLGGSYAVFQGAFFFFPGGFFGVLLAVVGLAYGIGGVGLVGGPGFLICFFCCLCSFLGFFQLLGICIYVRFLGFFQFF